MRLYRLLASTLLLSASAAIAQTQPPAAIPSFLPPLATPEPLVNPDHTVTFRLTAPNAQKVMLSLENHPAAAMQPADSTTGSKPGVWTITTSVLPPEWYSYHFLVDAQNELDPLNPKIVESYTAAGNTVLIPDASTPQPWEKSAVAHGVVHHHAYTSAVVRGLPAGQSEFCVYTPPGYDARAATKYPVLYLLHGWSDTAAGWTNIGHADMILDNLIAQGKARPMIVVMPLGYGDLSFLRSGFGVWNEPVAIDNNTNLFSQTLLTEILPQAEKLYNISSRREDRAIAGLSMGGLEALTIGLNHADVFAWVGGFSAAVHQVQPAALAALDPKRANLKYLYISVGSDDGLLDPDRKYAATLRSQGFDVTTVETPGNGHVWQQWRPDLVTFATHIFQPR